jgi:hypothetical protein
MPSLNTDTTPSSLTVNVILDQTPSTTTPSADVTSRLELPPVVCATTIAPSAVSRTSKEEAALNRRRALPEPNEHRTQFLALGGLTNIETDIVETKGGTTTRTNPAVSPAEPNSIA